MKDEDFYDLLDEVNAMSSEEYNEYHEQALSVKEGAEMTEESMFCDEKGKPLPRKNKFDMALYEAKVGTKQGVGSISVELDVKGARKTEYVCPPKSDTGADMYFEMDEGGTMDFILPNGDRYTVGFSSDMMTILGVTAHR